MDGGMRVAPSFAQKYCRESLISHGGDFDKMENIESDKRTKIARTLVANKLCRAVFQAIAAIVRSNLSRCDFVVQSPSNRETKASEKLHTTAFGKVCAAAAEQQLAKRQSAPSICSMIPSLHAKLARIIGSLRQPPRSWMEA
jgi:hypothetical protein